MDRNHLVSVMSEWWFQDDSKVLGMCRLVDLSAKYRYTERLKKVAVKQEQPSQTILLTSDVVEFV